MSNTKLSIFSAILLLGLVALLFQETALQNSIAMAQGYPPNYEENNYYEQDYNPYKDNKKNEPIVNIEKKLFVCNDVLETSESFSCTTQNNFPVPVSSREYIPCDDEICPGIDESDFAAQIFKDVATIRDLTPEGTPVNLDKFHYTVTEGRLDQRIAITDPSFEFCFPSDFSHSLFYAKDLGDNWVLYNICVDYVGDCEGIIYPGQINTCTIENYIWSGEIIEPSTDNPVATSPSQQQQPQQSNQAILSSQPSFLADIIPNLAN
jgi:hypothetical protein